MPIQPHQRRWIEENLIDHDIAFVVFDGVAVKHYFLERQTDDLDMFVGADEQTIGRLVGNIAQLRADPNSRAKLRDPGVAHFKVGDPLKFDVLTYAPGLQNEEALKTAEVVEVEGMAIPILSRELLIEHKRAVGEPKDMEDVALLLAGS